MRNRAVSVLYAALAFTWAACQSVQTQTRMVISNPEDGSPPVIHVQSGDGKVQLLYPQIGDSTPTPAPTSASSQMQRNAVEDFNGEATSHETTAPAVPKPSCETVARRLAYNSVHTSLPAIAITFDDGPHPELTPKLLDILKERGIRATFFVIGKNVETYPEIARRIVAEGHEIANHSWSHPALSKASAERVRSEITKTNAIIERVTGVRPFFMRPPYGATNQALNRRMNDEFGLKVIMWSVDPQDWRFRNALRVSSQLIQNAKPGDILLAHDIHASTIAAMPATLDALLAKGFRFLTVSELLALDSPTAQKAAHSALQ
jgi:peptidoglycan/xylan/chitin deacetylase (PgdA/CDA1 family)